MDVRFITILSLLVTAVSSVIDVTTRREFENVYFPLKGSLIRFKVKTSLSAIVTFVGKPSLDIKSDPYLEIGLGHNNNTSSFIRRTRHTMGLRWSKTHGLVSDKEFRGFWIKFFPPASFMVGKENEVIPLMVWKYPNPFKITHFGLGSCCGSTGEWKIQEDDDEKIEPPCAKDDVKVVDNPWNDEDLNMVKNSCFKILTRPISCQKVTNTLGSNAKSTPSSTPQKPSSTSGGGAKTKKKTYFIPDEVKNWDEAKAFCETRGQRLASVRNKEQQKELEKIIQGYKTLISGVWIGANDRASRNKFIWHDGSEDAVSFTNWESEDVPAHDVTGKNCAFASYVTLVVRQTAIWYLLKCDENVNFACEHQE